LSFFLEKGKYMNGNGRSSDLRLKYERLPIQEDSGLCSSP
jgi:hypothetical protein